MEIFWTHYIRKRKELKVTMSKMHFGQYLGIITEIQYAFGIIKGLMIVHKPFNIKALFLAGQTGLEPATYCSKGSILSEGTIGQGDGGYLEVFGKSEEAEYNAIQDKDIKSPFKPVEFKKVNMYEAECEYLADCILNRKKYIRLQNFQFNMKIRNILTSFTVTLLLMQKLM